MEIKKILSVAIMAVGAFAPAIADMIVLNDGCTVQCSNIDVSSDWIYCEVAGKLTKYPAKDVFGYKIGNGEMKTLNGAHSSNMTSNTVSAALATPAKDNQDLIARYNSVLEWCPGKTPTDKYTRSGFIYWGVDPKSVISTPDVEVSVEIHNKYSDPAYFKHFLNFPQWSYYITNKTSEPIYIDLANIFSIDTEGYGELWNNHRGLKEDDRPPRMNGMGMGTVKDVLELGLSATSIREPHWNNSTTSRFLSIDPGKKIELKRFATTSSFGTEDNVTKDQSDVKTRMKKWTLMEFSPADAPVKKSVILNYTKASDINNYQIMKIDFFPRVIYGVGSDKDVFTDKTITEPYFLWSPIYLRNQ